jgi:hypothetical protein
MFHSPLYADFRYYLPKSYPTALIILLLILFKKISITDLYGNDRLSFKITCRVIRFNCWEKEGKFTDLEQKQIKIRVIACRDVHGTQHEIQSYINNVNGYVTTKHGLFLFTSKGLDDVSELPVLVETYMVRNMKYKAIYTMLTVMWLPNMVCSCSRRRG